MLSQLFKIKKLDFSLVNIAKAKEHFLPICFWKDQNLNIKTIDLDKFVFLFQFNKKLTKNWYTNVKNKLGKNKWFDKEKVLQSEWSVI